MPIYFPPSRAYVILTTHIVVAIISTLFTGLRFYTARFITRHIRADDYLLIAAWFLALVYSVLGSLSTNYGLGRHLWDVPVSVFSPTFMILGAISGMFYGLSIMLTKLSLLTLFIRFTLWGSLRVVIYITMVIVVIYSLVASFEWVYACRPLEKYWDHTIPGGSCINWLTIAVFSGVMNSTTDVVMLILPVIILRNLRLPRRQKVGVMMVLMTGGLILVTSVIRLKRTLDWVDTTDITWQAVSTCMWGTIEVHMAVVCACLPAGKPFLRKYTPNIIRSSYGTSIRTKKYTIRSTQTQHLPSRDVDKDSQDIILEDDLNSMLQRHT
ncbi:hypothetical protein BKA66DRAFT_543905 [Pyrenochaeta sp. MPI-SDFR-AT-0127]|nr:hypothetical protein BKA66DRAFT_543905 [Pyrenochaeta sp. MPI-SDFR-AT-0127]